MSKATLNFYLNKYGNKYSKKVRVDFILKYL
jgi:hypothetical protein